LAQLDVYGKMLETYTGDGVFVLKDGSEVGAQFEVGQSADGRNVLCCILPFDMSTGQQLPDSSRVSRFVATTSEGYQLAVEGNFHETNYLPDLPETDESIMFVSYTADEIHVERSQPQVGKWRVHFGLTNLRFRGTRPERTGKFVHQGVPRYRRSYLVLPMCVDDTEIVLKPLADYEEVSKRVATLRDIDVTCEAVAIVENEAELARLTEVMENLCYLLSIAKGTKINWVYRDLYSHDGDRFETLHSYRITKPFVPLPIIDPRVPEDTKQFIESAYDAYVNKRDPYKLDGGGVDAYLDAKSEHDFIQMRGAKLAVALEILKSHFAHAHGHAHVLNPDVFDDRHEELEREFRGFLRGFFAREMATGEITRGELDMMTAKARGFNYRSLPSIMRKLRRSIDLGISEGELQLFVNSRNKLVHYGDFYCKLATDEERKRCPPLPSPADEWLFMVNFLDRVFLKLLGYQGHYLNWRTSPPEREWLD